jgi:hypothetical protein
MQKEKAQLLDSVLKYFYLHRNENVAPHNIWREFTDSDKEFYLTITDLDNKNLIEKTPGNNHTNPSMNMYRIASKGIYTMEAGGIEEIKKQEKIKEEKEALKETMEYQKLSAEIFDLNNRLKDYKSVKNQALVGIIIGVASLLLTILAFVFKK